MPVNVTTAVRDAETLKHSDSVLDVVKNPDLFVVIAFSVIGLLLTIACASFLPSPDVMASLFVSTS